MICDILSDLWIAVVSMSFGFLFLGSMGAFLVSLNDAHDSWRSRRIKNARAKAEARLIQKRFFDE